MQKKKILFIAPDYFGFNDVIYDAFSSLEGYDTQMILSNGPYKYKNLGERIHNFFLKNFTDKNLKTINSKLDLIRKVSAAGKVDVCIVNRSDMLDISHLKLINEVSEKTAVIFWDSFAKITGQKETMPYFDFSFSFDQNDVDQYGLHKISNFFFVENHETQNPEYDVFFLGAYDSRFEDLVRIFRYLKTLGLKVGARLYAYHQKTVPPDLTNEILLTREIIPFSKSYIFNVNTKVMLDLAHHHQSGLSFRPFEAMGLKKKLITTNANVKNYPFYHPDNIFVIEDTENINLDPGFIAKDYTDIPEEISAEYNSYSWAKKIITVIENG